MNNPSKVMPLRSALARTLYTRMMEDQYEQQNANHSDWYQVKRAQLTSDLCDTYMPMEEDEETSKFLQNCYTKADWMFTQILHLVIKSVLSWVMSTTSINGLLRRGSMFVYSKDQFIRLLQIPPQWQGNNLLDLGAGDGQVTQQMAPHYREVYVTEMSTTMNWRLQERGYHLLDADQWYSGAHQYDLISCLNLLDRCDKPVSLLHHIHRSLVPGTGRAVVAVVLPFSPYVEYRGEHQPEQYLHVSGSGFEQQVNSLVHDVFQPAGFRVERFTRLPYLCEGDLEHSFYLLYDAVFVLKPV